MDKDPVKRRSKWKINPRWALFIDTEGRKLKLTTKPEPYTFDKTLNWLSRQVAPTLKLAMKLDDINETSIINEMIHHAKLSERHEKLLAQQALSKEDVIQS